MKHRRNRIAMSAGVLALLLFACVTASAQISTEAEIVVTNSGSPQGMRTLSFGVNPTATNGIDVELGEEAFPPFPPTASFEARFVTHGGSDLGEGSPADIRPFASTSQKDEYKIKFQPGTNGLPVTLTWDKTYMSDHYTKVTMKDPFGGVILSVDMIATNTVQVTNANLTELVIEAEGPKQPGSSVENEQAAVESLNLQSTPNPAGVSTTVAYTLAKPSDVRLRIIDAKGAVVATVVENGRREIGTHAENVDASLLAEGIYFVSLEVDGIVASKELVVVR